MKTALFWVITQRVVVIPYRHFRTNYWFHLQGSRIPKRDDTEYILALPYDSDTNVWTTTQGMRKEVKIVLQYISSFYQIMAWIVLQHFITADYNHDQIW